MLSLIRVFLARQFTKVVSAGSEHQYRLSASIAEILMEGEADGVVYASIASVQSGVNVALRTRSVDRLYEPASCTEIEIEEKIGPYQYKAKMLRRSKKLSSRGAIVWE